MVKKSKISDLAKDLKITSKELIGELNKYFEETLKASTGLTDEIANVALEIFSRKHEVGSFEKYFESAVSKKKETIAKEVSKKLEVAKPTKKEEKIKKELAKPLQDDEAKEAPVRKNPKNGLKQKDSFKAVEKSVEVLKKNKLPKKKDRLKNIIELKPDLNSPVTKLVSEDESQTRRRMVTKTVDVNLEKYNERYEKMAGEKQIKDGFQRKQKFKRRSLQKDLTKKETEAQKLQRLALERARKQKLKVSIPDEINVGELASRLKITVSELIKKLMALGVMAGINDVIDFDSAAVVAEEIGAEVEHEVKVTIEERLFLEEEYSGENLVKRNPVVVVMGHVDHGKTSLLDRIRNSNVSSSEAGGITQHIGAYTVEDGKGNGITFLDTPGHEAFTSMRMRGANITDIAVLVVAADDGVMPQTVEAINHAKAANVSIIVAINKIDKKEANVENIKQKLTEYGLVAEEWGGDIICVPVSAKTGEGLDQLLEMVNLVAEVKDLKACVNCFAKGSVIEAYLDKGKGPIATLLVQNGTLKVGDFLIAGTAVGHVRAMVNDKGKEVSLAGPSTPVKITGLCEVPLAGDVFNAVKDEKLAKELVERRKFAGKQEQFATYNKVTLDNLFSQIEDGERRELAIVVKADVQGSVEAVKSSIEKLSNKEVRVRVIHGAVGAINKSDVMLANASGAIVIGFNVRPDSIASVEAEENKIEIRLYRVIYEALEDLEKAIKGMLKPKTRVVELGSAQVRQVYRISNVGTIAGCYVSVGKILRKAQARVVRDGVVVAEDLVKSLKRFKDDVKEVAKEFECGIGLEKFNDVKVGDVIESFMVEEYRD